MSKLSDSILISPPRGYLAVWVLLCVLAIILTLLERNALTLFKRDYWRFLTYRWKITTFLVAALSMILVAPQTGDQTWDYYDAAFMSLLTFLTAPWSVSTLFRCLSQRTHFRTAYIAAVVWMFSASWSYDLYILLRDGVYPATWLVNIGASSILYMTAGLLWSLEYDSKLGGTVFAFRRADWPAGSVKSPFSKIAWVAVPFMLIPTFCVLLFFWK